MKFPRDDFFGPFDTDYIFCDCTARFVSDLVETKIVGFLTHRLKLSPKCPLDTTKAVHEGCTNIKEKKVQVGKDQEKAQSEKDSHSKNQGGKKPNSGTYTMKTFRKPNEQLFSQ